MNGTDGPAGTIELHPGRPLPNIRSTRPALARALVAGKPAALAPDLLARVFALCGGAQRLTAQRAIAAAQGQAGATTLAEHRALQLDTLREHLRRIWLDWPAALTGQPAQAQDLAALRDCPLLRRGLAPEAALAGMGDWLQAHALGLAPAAWLQAWEADPQAWLLRWCEPAATLPARLLRACRERARALGAPPLPLRVHGDDAALAALAARLAGDAGFARAPSHEGSACETGPWTRLNDRTDARIANAWLRLGARLAEAVRLVLDDAPARAGALWLRQGALALGPGAGLGWCEMARGLLVHRVLLDARAPSGVDAARGGALIAEYDVLAPTEWNFHPRGAVAQALAAQGAGVDDAALRMLAAAFDPCVAVRIVHPGGGDA